MQTSFGRHGSCKGGRIVLYLITTRLVLQNPFIVFTCCCAFLGVRFSFRCTCVIKYRTRMLLKPQNMINPG